MDDNTHMPVWVVPLMSPPRGESQMEGTATGGENENESGLEERKTVWHYNQDNVACVVLTSLKVQHRNIVGRQIALNELLHATQLK